MNNATTYTDIVVTQEPVGDPSPLASWSNAVVQTWLLPPFVSSVHTTCIFANICIENSNLALLEI